MKYEGIEIWANSIRALVLITALAAAVCVIVYRAEIEELTGEPVTPEMQAALEELMAEPIDYSLYAVANDNAMTFSSVTEFADTYVSRTVISLRVDGSIEIFNPKGDRLILINADGSSEIGPDYKPDVAAQQFWKAVARYMPQWKGEK